MKSTKQLAEHRIFGCSRQNVVKFAIEEHELFGITRRTPIPGAIKGIRKMKNILALGPLCCELGAIAFIEDANLDDLQYLIQAHGLYDDAFARDHLHHAFQHQPIYGLMNWCTSDSNKLGDISFIDIVARLELASRDAMLDEFISGIAQRLRFSIN